MPPIYLTEADVERLVTVKDAMAALEALFATWGPPSTPNLPRPLPGGSFNLMGAAYGARAESLCRGQGRAVSHAALFLPRRQPQGGDRGRSVRADAHRRGKWDCDQAFGQRACAHSRRHWHRQAITHASCRRLRGQADQAN